MSGATTDGMAPPTAAILTHAERPRIRALAAPVDPLALLAALADRSLPVLARTHGCTVVAADPAEVARDEEVWNVLAAPPQAGEWPMAGGWIGVLGYDLATSVERLPVPRPDPGGPPRAALGRYDTVALIDPDGRCTLVGRGTEEDLDDLARAASRARRPPGHALRRRPPLTSSLDPGAYRAAVERVRELIAAGDCYQVNLTQRLTAPWVAGGLALAGRLWAAAGPSSHRAFVGLPEGAVVSASPERLVRVRNGIATSEPIKGTARPGHADALAASPKDRAEHVMIVDLVRNDLGRVARPGGVSVERLMEPLYTPYVSHLVSGVRAELSRGVVPAQVLRALFPGGSVTGCPKVRAMEVIHELEPVGRGPAYGSVVAVGRDGSIEASVAIRTAWVNDEQVRYWCGGAVVWDSDPEAERREAWAKAAPLVRALEP